MFAPRILSKAPFAFDAIKVELSHDEWVAAPGYETLASAAWKEQLARATHRVWDGAYYRVLNVAAIALNSPITTLCLGTIRYRYIATFRSLHEHHARLGLAALHHPSTIGLIRTSDDFYLFGKRASSGAVELIGGGVQKDQLAISRGIDLELNLRKEIREETGIRETDIAQTRGIGVVLSETSNILLVAHVACRMTRAQAEARFTQRDEREMSEPVFVMSDRLRPFLAGLPDYRNLILELP